MNRSDLRWSDGYYGHSFRSFRQQPTIRWLLWLLVPLILPLWHIWPHIYFVNFYTSNHLTSNCKSFSLTIVIFLCYTVVKWSFILHQVLNQLNCVRVLSKWYTSSFSFSSDVNGWYQG